jgi:hypothetical protein
MKSHVISSKRLAPRGDRERYRDRLAECRLLELPKIAGVDGSLTYVEGPGIIPFEPRRAFYVYDLAKGAKRAGHALVSCRQVLIAVAGSFDIVVDDGDARARFTLDRPSQGLYLPARIWRDLSGFSAGAVCLVLASDPYAESSYIRSYDAFKAMPVAPE